MFSKLFQFFKPKEKAKEATPVSINVPVPFPSQEVKKEPVVDKYKDAVFVNRYCQKLEDFIINDEINNYDLMKLADLNEIPLHINGGWYPLVLELLKELDAMGWDRTVSCIKEKYAELRFHADYEYSDVLDKYTERSRQTCETCGDRGEVRGSVWMFVACRKHYLKGLPKMHLEEHGFYKDGVSYNWQDFKDMYFDEEDYYEQYRWLKAELKPEFTRKYQEDILYISRGSRGFGEFIQQIPSFYKSLDYSYIEKHYKEPEFCEVCGYKALYLNDCECCENTSWEVYQSRWDKDEEEKLEYLKFNQIEWALDNGDQFEVEIGRYLKNPNHQILFTKEELEEYDEL